MGEIEKALQYASLTITPKEIHYIDVELSIARRRIFFKMMNNMILPRYIYKVYLSEDRYYDTKADACMR
jgi:hypothetical protein